MENYTWEMRECVRAIVNFEGLLLKLGVLFKLKFEFFEPIL